MAICIIINSKYCINKANIIFIFNTDVKYTPEFSITFESILVLWGSVVLHKSYRIIYYGIMDH